jgi:hypothetical protein
MDKVKDSNYGKGNCQETFYLKFFQKICLMTCNMLVIGLVRFGFAIKNVGFFTVTPILDVSRKSSMCVTLALDTLKIYNIKTSNECRIQQMRSYNKIITQLF